MNFASLITVMLLAATLGGCDWQTLKSSVGGSCAVFERPTYAVRGKTPYDQNVVDNFVESGVGGCNWARPAPRPPQLDAAKPRQPSMVAPARKPARKPGILSRIKHRVQSVWPEPQVLPQVVAPEAPVSETLTPVDAAVPAEPVQAPPIVMPPPRRSAIDELLNPR